MKTYFLAIAACVLLLISCKSTTKATPEKSLALDFEAKTGSTAKGSATFTEVNGEVTFTGNFSNLKPGIHAIHIHEKSDCTSPDASSAGGHWNPTFQSHGKWGAAAYHRGDIGNFTTNTSGEGTISLTTNEWCIGCGDPKKDILGKSVIVHAGADDYVTQPSGDSGARIACTAIIR
ncbi:MAG TPA: superoxide dismutase family protein [Flavobacterium sp.]|jgi:Cu-Zn family superoxide dismutase